MPNSSRVGAARTSGSIVPAARRHLGAAAQLEVSEDPERQDEELHGHPGEQRPVLARGRPPLLQHGAFHERVGEPEQDRGPRGRRQQTEQLGSGVEVDGEHHPGELFAVRAAGELRQHQPQEQTQRVGHHRVGERLQALCGQQRPLREPAAVQHGELEGLAGERQRPHPRQHGQRHRADLDHDEQDRDPKVLHALIHDAEQRVEPGREADRGHARLFAHDILGVEQLAGNRARLVVREIADGEVGVPGELARQPQRRGGLEVGLAVHEQRRGVGGIRRPGTGCVSRTRTDPRGRASRTSR